MFRLKILNKPQIDSALQQIMRGANLTEVAEAGHRQFSELSDSLLAGLGWSSDAEWSEPNGVKKGEFAAESTAESQSDVYGWVDMGTNPVNIYDTYMRFPYQGRGASYSAKSDAGTGERLGPLTVMYDVENRSIEARRLTKRVLDDYTDEIIAEMVKTFRV